MSIGPKNDSGSIKGNIGITGVEGKVNIDNKSKVTASGDSFVRKAHATMGKGPLSIKASNSSTVGWSGKVYGAKVGMSANLYKAGAGVVKLVEGAVSYTKDVISNLLSWE